MVGRHGQARSPSSSPSENLRGGWLLGEPQGRKRWTVRGGGAGLERNRLARVEPTENSVRGCPVGEVQVLPVSAWMRRAPVILLTAKPNGRARGPTLCGESVLPSVYDPRDEVARLLARPCRDRRMRWQRHGRAEISRDFLLVIRLQEGGSREDGRPAHLRSHGHRGRGGPRRASMRCLEAGWRERNEARSLQL